MPVKIGRDQAPDFLGDVGHAEDAAEIQQNIVRIDGQRSVYIPVMKQGSANTIAVVQGVKAVLPQITDLPKGMKVNAIFGQDTYIKAAVESLEHEAVSGAGTRFAHDPDLPRQFSLDHRDFPFDSTVHFGGRLWTHDEWFNHQHHDPWRLCARDWPSAR
ncbi:MAG: efflux RND transporter permease subunit [Candidatus Binataceae bacterium]